MKTPRELLLSRHKSAEQKLDAIRATALKTVNNQETRERSFDLVAWFLCCSQAIWRELIFPARRIWTGFAFAWLVIITINLAESDHSSPNVLAKGKPAPAGALLAWREQQKILAELFGNAEPLDAEKPKHHLPQPRSERQELWKFV